MGTFGMSGQAVLEGVLMKNADKYAVAVRKPDNDIEVTVERLNNVLKEKGFLAMPFIRGIVSFIEELYLGIKNFSVLGKFYEEQENKEKIAEKKGTLQLLIAITLISLAIGLFVVLPYGINAICGSIMGTGFVRIFIEGIIRLVLLILYVILISIFPEIKRMYMYLGAGHKALNCFKKGIPLTVSNVRRMSRNYYRCGTVYVFTVIIVSLILFMFVRVENNLLRILIRLCIIPFVAAVVYESREILLNDRNIVSVFLNIPLLLVHGIVSSEPGEEMIEVAIRAATVLDNKQEIEKEETEKVATKENEDKWYKNNKPLLVETSVKNDKDSRIQNSSEDDEIMNAFNYFFNSKTDSKNKGKIK